MCSDMFWIEALSEHVRDKREWRQPQGMFVIKGNEGTFGICIYGKILEANQVRIKSMLKGSVETPLWLKILFSQKNL